MTRIGTLYKNAYSGLSPAMWWLSLVMLINRMGTMVMPFLTLYLTQSMHYTIGRAGLVVAIFGLGAICGGVLGGKLTDKLGFYNIQLGALISGGILFILLGQIKDFSLLCIVTFILALLNESFRPANATAIAHYSNEGNRTRCYSLNRLSINLGWAVGGALAGFIASANYHLLFWIDGLSNIGAAALLAAVLAPSRSVHTPSQKDTPVVESTRSAYSDRKFLVFIVLTILFGICFFQIFSTLPVFFKEQLHLDTFFIGVIMSVNGILIALFEMALVFVLEQKQRNLQYIMIGVLLTGLSFVVFNVLPGAFSLAMFSTLILTAGEMLAMPFMNAFWISRTDATNRGQYAGLYTAAWSIAQVVGPLGGAQVVYHFSFVTLWWAIGIISMITAAGYRWLQVRSR